MPKNSKKFLVYLNETYFKLHKKYEESFWLFRMGDFSYGEKMNKNEALRDAFRSNSSLKNEVERHLKGDSRAHLPKAKSKIKARLLLWKNFFELYQTPEHVLPIRKKIAEIENKMMKIKSSAKEGYIDPKTGTFVEARENKMRFIMRTDPDEAIRKACFESMEKMPLDTLDLYIEVIGLRNQYAQALGYEDFYAYKARIDEGMTKKELFSIFDNIYEKTKHGFKTIRDLEKEKPGLRKPWNFSYMFSGNFTALEDPYFQFENVLSYWGRSFAALGISFHGGKVMLDLLDRKGKWNNGFCHYTDIVHYKNGKRVPGSSGFTSTAVLGQVGSGVNAIHTVFHEGGHAADRLNSMQEDVCINTEYPPDTVSWAETQSMFMDSISSSIEWKTRYAKNEKGEAYPFDLFLQKLHSVHPMRILDMMYISRVVFFEKEIYECKNLTKEFVLETAKKIYKKCFDYSEDSIGVLNTPHIYSWESSAYYHGYGIAELGVCQWREYFFKKYGFIVDNPKVGKELQKIWSYASLFPAKKLLQLATKKPLSPDAYLRDVSMSLKEIISKSKEKIKRLEKVPLSKKPVDLKGRITLVHGKKKIADNSKSFEIMDKKYRAWLATLK